MAQTWGQDCMSAGLCGNVPAAPGPLTLLRGVSTRPEFCPTVGQSVRAQLGEGAKLVMPAPDGRANPQGLFGRPEFCPTVGQSVCAQPREGAKLVMPEPDGRANPQGLIGRPEFCPTVGQSVRAQLGEGTKLVLPEPDGRANPQGLIGRPEFCPTVGQISCGRTRGRYENLFVPRQLRRERGEEASRMIGKITGSMLRGQLAALAKRASERWAVVKRLPRTHKLLTLHG